MKLSKGKISKLLNKSKQSLKKKLKSKLTYSKTKTFRKKKQYNLARKSLKHIHNKGGTKPGETPLDETTIVPPIEEISLESTIVPPPEEVPIESVVPSIEEVPIESVVPSIEEVPLESVVPSIEEANIVPPPEEVPLESVVPSIESVVPPIEEVPLESNIVPPLEEVPPESNIVPPPESTIVPPIEEVPLESTIVPPIEEVPLESNIVPPIEEVNPPIQTQSRITPPPKPVRSRNINPFSFLKISPPPIIPSQLSPIVNFSPELNQPIEIPVESNNLTAAVDTIIDHISNIVSEKVIQNISSGNNVQNGFDSVNKAVEKLALNGGNKTRKKRKYSKRVNI